MRNLIVILMPVVLLSTLGCATFPGNQLPKQTAKPQMMKNPCLVTETVSFDGTSSMGNVVPSDFFSQNLKKVIAASGGIYLSQQQNEVENLKASQEVLNRVEANMVKYERLIPQIRQQKLEGIFMTTYYVPDSAKKEELFQKLLDKEAHVEFCRKMRTDSAFRSRILPPDAVWFDCETSLKQGNWTWFLEGLVCSCSLTLLPAHHNKVLAVSMTTYANGRVLSRKSYEDYWNAWFWLPLFPFTFIQGDWPDPETITSVKDNMATTAVLDFQRVNRK